MESGLLVAVVGVLAAGVLYGLHRLEQRRRAMWAAAAAHHGWTYEPHDDRYADRWSGTPFGRGRSREAADVVTGTHRGRPMTAFSYSYETESAAGPDGRRTTTTHRYAVVALAMPAFLPGLELTREGVLQRVARLVGLSDLDLESEAFNRRFRLTAEDPRTATAVLTPRTMERLLAAPGDLAYRVEGADLLCWTDGSALPEDVGVRADVLADVLDLVPAFVWADHGARPA